MAAENGLGQMFVAGAGLDEMTAQVRRFNTIRAGMGLPPDQPTTLLWMYRARPPRSPRKDGSTSATTAAQHHYFEWNNPGYAGIPGYEEYLKRQTADVGVADAPAARRATQPIGTPDEIIEKIRTLQHASAWRWWSSTCSTADARAKAEKACGCSRKRSFQRCGRCRPRSTQASLGQLGAS